MKITPRLAAAAAALVTAPVTAFAAASVPALADQVLAYLVTALASAIAAAIAGVVTKVAGARLDQAARDALRVTLENAANEALPYVLAMAADTPLGRRLELGLKRMLGYTEAGAPGALERFGLLTSGPAARMHLEQMAQGRLVEQIAKVKPDLLTQALASAGAPAAADRPRIR